MTISPSKAPFSASWRNGVDYDWFQASLSHSRIPEALQNIRRPRVGYTGTLSSWLDYGLVAVLARTFPDVSFVFVGPLDSEFRIESLKPYKNVHWLGRKEYREIPSYINAFDVCLIPFVAGRIAQTTNPVKIFEYFALGKPVVTTPLPELESYRDRHLVYMARTPEEFVESVRTALDENEPGKQTLRRSVAQEHSWRILAGRMVSVFDSVDSLSACP